MKDEGAGIKKLLVMFGAVIYFFHVYTYSIQISHDISKSSDKILPSMTSVTAAQRWANDDVGPIMHHGVKDPKDVTSFYYQECSFFFEMKKVMIYDVSSVQCIIIAIIMMMIMTYDIYDG